MKIKQIVKSVGCFTALMVMLVGCDKNMQVTQEEQLRDLAAAQEFYDQTHKAIEQHSMVEHSNDYYVAQNSYQIEKPIELAPVFNKNVIYASSVTESLADVLTDMYAQTGIKFVFAPDAIKYINPAGGGATLSGAAAGGGAKAGAAGAASQVVVGSSAVASNIGLLSDVQLNLQYTGLFKDFVDRIASKFNIFWSYDPKDKSVHFFRTQTKVFALDVLPGATTFSNNISTSATVGGSSSGSNLNSGAVMTVTYDNKLGNAWDDTASTIKAMLTPEGTSTENRRTGYVTVTDIPERITRIESFINKINDKARRKIAVKVDVFDVLVDRTTDYGINWDAVIDALGGDVSVTSGVGASANPVGALGKTLTNTLMFNYTGSGFFDAAQALFQALSTVGDTSTVTGTTVYTVNGEPAPVQVVERQDYISQITFSAISDQSSTTQVSVTPSTVISGFFMVITPSILSNNQILLNLSFSLSVADISSAGRTQNVCSGPAGPNQSCTQVTLPIVKSKNFMESVTLNAGQSVILSGFQELENQVGVESVAEPSLWPLGGNKAVAHQKTITVTLVTPYLIGR